MALPTAASSPTAARQFRQVTLSVQYGIEGKKTRQMK